MGRCQRTDDDVGLCNSVSMIECRRRQPLRLVRELFLDYVTPEQLTTLRSVLEQVASA